MKDILERVAILETRLEEIPELKQRIAKLERAVYMAAGALALLQLILNFTKR